MTRDTPKVSVIIPTYNRAHLLPRAIKSVLNQTFKDFELIIIDDGSIDETEEVVKKFQKEDERIKYIKHNTNMGGGAARNTGIKVSRGEYIAFQDSDDEWLPEKLEKQIKVFKNIAPEISVIYTGFWKVKGNKKTYIPSKRITKKEGDIHKELLKGNFVTTQVAIVKRECFKKSGMFDETLPRLQDWDLWIRISKYYCFKYINEPLVFTYYTSDSISADNTALIESIKLILGKYYKEFEKHKTILANYQYIIGSLLCQNDRLNEGRKYFSKAMKSYFLNPKYLLATIISLGGASFYKRITKLKHQISL
ncbi:MAG: glycosyltransferase family 2 protein [Candidatus Helarchaeota archaeon]